MFHPLTLHGSYGNASRTQRRRAWRCAGPVTTWCTRHRPSACRFISSTIRRQAGRCGAAFPRILPTIEPAERAARLRPERQALLRLLGSSAYNAWAAARWA